MKIEDGVLLGDALQVDENGYLRVNARTARTGIQVYSGAEVGRPELAAVNVYRDEAEVFSKSSLNTFANIPITVGHPEAGVNAQSWRDKAVGNTLEEVLRDGEYLKIGLKIMDAAAVQAVKDGTRELSVGYETQLVWEDGKAPDGTPYQAKQTGIVANHIAIVPRGRAGSKARIGDDVGKWGASPVNDATPEKDPPMTLKTVTVDGIPVEVTDQGATVITTLQQRLADAGKKLTDTEAAHAAALAAKDADLAKKDAQIDDLKKKVLDQAAIDRLVADRAGLVSLAGTIAKDVKTDGLSDADIRKAVVTAKLGDAAVKDKPQAYIDARFDILAEDVKKTTDVDPFRAAVQNGIKTSVGDAQAANDANAKAVNDLNAWRNQKEA